MKKFVAKITSMILVFTMLFLLGACSQSSEKDALVGTWSAEMNLAEMLNEEMGMDEEMAAYMTVDEFIFVLTVTFNDDDSCQLSLDESSVEAAVSGLKEDMRVGLENYITDMIAAMEMEMTVEEFLEASGMDLDAMLDEAFGEETVDALLADMGTLNMDCFYKVESGKIYLLDNKNDAVDEDEYVTYTLEEGQMTFQEFIIDGEVDEEMAPMMPLVFSKVAE